MKWILIKLCINMILSSYLTYTICTQLDWMGATYVVVLTIYFIVSDIDSALDKIAKIVKGQLDDE